MKLRFLPTLFLALTPGALADVLVVDFYGGGDFVDLQPAIDAASDGDTILIRGLTYTDPPSYTDFSIDGKSLSLIGPSDTPVKVHAGTVTNLAAGRPSSCPVFASSWACSCPTMPARSSCGTAICWGS